MYTRFLLGVLSVMCVSVCGVSLAQAAHDSSMPSAIITNEAQLSGQDRIARQDFDAYQKSSLRDRFAFHMHKDVCTTPTTAESASCAARVITDAANKPLSSTSPYPSALGPAQLLQAYNLMGVTAHPQVVAIVDAYDDPNIYADLTTYSQQYGLPVLPQCTGTALGSSVPCFQKINQNGQTTSYPTADASWSLEIALDVEVAHAVCQNCTILLVEASNASYTTLVAADDQAVAQGAKIVSNSWGGGEFLGETSYDSHYNKPGVAFLFSSGDAGYGVEYPAASSYVTAVGGTTLLRNADGSYNTETAWSGAGSGCSVYEAKPTWQSDSGCARRTVADVSADADPNTGASVYDSVAYSGMTGWFQVGGTSLAAPIVAGTYALAGIPPANVSENSLPYANPLQLHDVVSGANGSCGGSYLCTAMVGYDGPTGLGTPNGAGAFTGAPVSNPTPTVILSANPTSLRRGQSSKLTWSSTNVTSCVGTNFSTNNKVSGSVTVNPSRTTTYALSCTGAGGTAAKSVTVNVR